MGSSIETEEMLDMLCKQISDETIFGADEDIMFFFVREGFSLSQRTEGFTRQMKVTSENLNGEVIVDGWWKHHINLGESFELSMAGDEGALTALKLLMD